MQYNNGILSSTKLISFLFIFAKHSRTVAVDMRGFGDSDKPVGASNYTMDILVNDLKGIIENLGTHQITKYD